MENSNLPDIVVMRWNEAVEKDSVPAWRSLASMAGFQAEIIERNEPDSIMAAALLGVSRSAFDRYIQLQKVNEYANAT